MSDGMTTEGEEGGGEQRAGCSVTEAL
jgi:hypothetical protein